MRGTARPPALLVLACVAVVLSTGTSLGAAAAAAAATEVRCSNSRTSDHVLVHNESAQNVSCAKVHSLMSRAWLWRSGTFAWGPFLDISHARFSPSGWRNASEIVYVSKKNFVLDDICGATERFTSRSRSFRITWGRVTPWRIP